MTTRKIDFYPWLLGMVFCKQTSTTYVELLLIKIMSIQYYFVS